MKLASRRWSSICGNLEPGESVLEGGARELVEETSIVTAPANLEFGTFTHFVNDEGHGPAFAIFFTTSAWVGTPRIMEPDKCDQLGWFDLDDLPSPIVPYVKNSLADLQRGRRDPNLAFAFSTFGWSSAS